MRLAYAPARPTWFLSLYLGWIMLAAVLNFIFGLRDGFGLQWSGPAEPAGLLRAPPRGGWAGRGAGLALPRCAAAPIHCLGPGGHLGGPANGLARPGPHCIGGGRGPAGGRGAGWLARQRPPVDVALNV
ncbi:MAG: hypothetical protein WKG07_01745 [Hymenobacter sp.]